MLAEKVEAEVKPHRPFEEMFELSMRFLANPCYLWESTDLSHKKMALKLTFEDKLVYCRKEGLRTPKTTYIFKVLGRICGRDSQMAEGEGFEPSIRC